MKKYIIIFLMAFVCLQLNGQVTGEVNGLDKDIFHLTYTPPNVISDDFNYQRTSVKLGIPPIRLGKLSLYSTLGFDMHILDYQDDTYEKLSNQTETMYNISLSTLAQYKLSEKWSLNALTAPFLASNFDDGLSSSDLNFNGNAFIERTFFLKNGGYFQAGLGVGYITLNGKTSLIPLTHLKGRLNKKWSFVLSLPNTNVKWDINRKHSLKALVDLNDIATNTGSSLLSDNVETSVFTVASAGLEYNYWLSPSVGLMVRASHSIWENHELRDGQQNTVYEFDSALQQPFLTVGVKFNPLRKFQNKLNPAK